jgi:aminomethyltransferase
VKTLRYLTEGQVQCELDFATYCQENQMTEIALKRTPLYETHKTLGAKIVPFAGYEMPVQYPAGVMAEHNWTRQHAGLFDVSHMGQATLRGPDFETTARFLETLVPADVLGLAKHQQRYSQLLNDDGGIIDDLMFIRGGRDGEVYLVVNAGCKESDYRWIEKHLPENIKLRTRSDLSLLALQGPKAETILARLSPEITNLKFMQTADVVLNGINCYVSRSGYSGEDGFEISVFENDVLNLWNLLLADAEVKPIGLGARDSLRLEAGLCLYGHDIDESTSPIEAGLQWSIAKRRREEGGFIGAARVQLELRDGPKRKRVGIKPAGRAPAREGTEIQNLSGEKIGIVTSGGFGPTVGGPIAMGYIATADTKINLIVRGQSLPADVVKLPFVAARFKRS